MQHQLSMSLSSPVVPGKEGEGEVNILSIHTPEVCILLFLLIYKYILQYLQKCPIP